jgi:hypothetical protein
VIETPPLLTGADHVRDTDALPTTPATFVGALAGAAATVAADCDEYAPVPTAFTAAIRNTYDVPFVRPVTVAVGDVDVPSENVSHDEPTVLTRYCTT